MSAEPGPDERVFRAHVQAGPFQNGLDRGYWRLLSLEWPYAIVAISAVPRDGAPTEYSFRFECSGYPQAAPTAQPWDPAHQAPLAASQWPFGRERVPKVFRPDWKGGQCLYLPCDRISMQGHAAWIQQHPHMIWKATSDITLYLEIIYELLNSSDYTGIRGA